MKTIIDLYKNLLAAYVGFQSISPGGTHDIDLDDCSKWLVETFEKNGFSAYRFLSENPNKKRNPIVVARYTIDDPKARTILIYGHYDVQPTIGQTWTSEPFELTEREEKLFGRGSMDNKGQLAIHMATAFQLIKENNLGCNLIFLVEGDEETGSAHIREFLEEQKESLKFDYAIISDGELIGGRPTIEATLRGTFQLKVKIKTGEKVLHSGTYGGAIPNPVVLASQMIAKIFAENSDYEIAIPGFYNGAAVDKETENYPLSLEEIRINAGVKSMSVKNTHAFQKNTGILPTLNITGIQGGLPTSMIPYEVEFYINGRVGPWQDVKEVVRHTIDFLSDFYPTTVAEITIEKGIMCPSTVCNIATPEAMEMMNIAEKVYGKQKFIKHVGGSVPIVNDIQNIFEKEVYLIPLAGDTGNMHGADENMDVNLAEKGLQFSYEILKKK